jgi:hypothetical protein
MGRALRPAALIVVVGVVVVLVSGQQYAGSVFVLALCYGIVTAGMAVQIGFSQQIVFSQCVFMGFGAYGVAMLNTHYAVPSLLATPVVMVAAGLAALLLGAIVTRASGLALAVATLMLPLIATGYISSAGYLGGSVGAPLTGNLWAGSTTQSIAIGNGLITVAVLGLVVRAERRGEIHAPEHHRGQRAGQPRPGSARRRRRDPAPAATAVRSRGQPHLPGGAPDPRPDRAGQRRGRLPDLAPVRHGVPAVPQRARRGQAEGRADPRPSRHGRAERPGRVVADAGEPADGRARPRRRRRAPESWLNAASKGTSAQAKQTAAGLKEYFAGMKAAGYTSENQLDNSQEGWDAGLEINWAVTSAGTLDETAVMHKLQHLNINTLGIVWARTPANYENISQVLAAMETIGPDGSVALYDAAK